MKRVTTDVDIDVQDRDEVLSKLQHISGRIERSNGKIEKHLTGVYFQNIPRDPSKNMATIDHKVAASIGYFKIDILNVSVYDGVRDEEHLIELMEREPQWELFEYEDITNKLFQLNGHSSLLQKIKPKSVEDLATVLALIRPAKAYLRDCPIDKIREDIWKKAQDGEYDFKRSHAISYALAIIVDLNLLVESVESNPQVVSD